MMRAIALLALFCCMVSVWAETVASTPCTRAGLQTAVDKYTRLLLLTLDEPDEVRSDLDSHLQILQRRRYPADYQLGLCLTLYSFRQ